VLIGERRDISVDFSPCSRGATWGSYNGRIVHPTGRRCYARFQGRAEFRWTGKTAYQMGSRHSDTTIQESSQTSDSSSRPAETLLPISPAEVSEAISKLQREKARIQRDLDQKKAELADIRRRMDELIREKDHLAADNDRKQQLIKRLHQELAGEEAELDDEDDDPLLHRLRRECERRVKDCEERLKRSQADGEMQSI